MRALALLPVACLLAACETGPIPVEQAERQCAERAWNATRPQSSVGIGVGTDGHRTWTGAGISIGVSSDYLQGRDPNEVYTSCVVQRSGQYPTRPLYNR